MPQRGVGQALRKYKLGSSAGQALIVLLLAMPLFFGMAAVVVDGTLAWVGKRSSQNAADAAALAAVQELKVLTTPADLCDAVCAAAQGAAPGLARAVAIDYIQRNGGPTTECPAGDPDAKNCYIINYPYRGPDGTGTADPLRIEVKVRESTATFFGRFFGLGDGFFRPKARAVASAEGVTEGQCVYDEPVDEPAAECEIPGTPDRQGTPVQGDPVGHCINFDPPVDDPDQYYGAGCVAPTEHVGGTIGAVAFANSTDCTRDDGGAALQYQGAGGGQIGALVTNGGIEVSGSPGQPKTIDYLSLGRLGQSVSDVPCYDNFQNGGDQIATINDPPVVGPYAPMAWPVTPPTPPTPPNGCSAASVLTQVATKSLSGTTAVLSTTVNHGLRVQPIADKFVVSIGDSRFDGWHTLTDRTNTTITYTVPTAGTVAANTPASGTVTATSQDVGINSDAWKNTHPAGIYCVTGTGSLSFSGVTLNGYTFFVAGDIGVNGGTYSCYQYCDPFPSSPPTSGPLPTLFFAGGDINIQASDANLTGYIFATSPEPAGNVTFAGGGNSGGKGFIEAQKVTFSGNLSSYTGAGMIVGGEDVTPRGDRVDPTPNDCEFAGDPPVEDAWQYYDEGCLIEGAAAQQGEKVQSVVGVNLGMDE